MEKTVVAKVNNYDVENYKSAIHCFYCGCYDEKVEAGGIYYCPNPNCSGPGIRWFYETLNSFKDEPYQNCYSVNADEKNIKADEYIKNNNLKFMFLDKLDKNIKEKNINDNKNKEENIELFNGDKQISKD
jgi:hypothetical protein